MILLFCNCFESVILFQLLISLAKLRKECSFKTCHQRPSIYHNVTKNLEIHKGFFMECVLALLFLFYLHFYWKQPLESLLFYFRWSWTQSYWNKINFRFFVCLFFFVLLRPYHTRMSRISNIHLPWLLQDFN